MTDRMDLDSVPKLISAVVPEYPQVGRDSGWEGRVLVGVLVDTNGSVLTARLVRPCVYPVLNNTARKSAMRCKFTPAFYEGRTVRAWELIPYWFRLD